MDSPTLRRHCGLELDARRLLDTAYDRLHLSARALTRILKVARTIADLESREQIGPAHVAEAIQYRSMDRRTAGRGG
jgi:magnesium chelatase family protein